MLSSRILRRALEYSHLARNSIGTRDPQLAGRGPKCRPRIRASPGGSKMANPLAPPAWRPHSPALCSLRRRLSPRRQRRPDTTHSPSCSRTGAPSSTRPMKDGAPDYTAATIGPAARRNSPPGAARLGVDRRERNGRSSSASTRQLVRAEMNGFDFYARVLQPWARDPAFYLSVWPEQSDTPAHEGTVHHDVVELWTYSFPLSREAEAKLAARARDRPAPPRAGAGQSHGQCARPLGHRRRHDARPGRNARRARQEDGRQRPGAQAGDRRGPRSDGRVRRLAR